MMDQASQAMVGLLFNALDHGIDSVKAAGGPLIPFVMYDTGGEVHLVRMVTEKLEDGPIQCRDLVRQLPDTAQRYALAFDGYITIADERTDAIVVEAGERGMPQGVRFAQCYRPKRGFFSRFSTLGNPKYLDDIENYLA